MYRDLMDDQHEPLVAPLPRDECGVCAVSGTPAAAELVGLGLYSLQHRGQETAGIASASGNGNGVEHHVFRGMGLVRDVITDNALATLPGDVAIGHVRYSTTGQPVPSNTQPLASSLRYGPVALAHNGNLSNAREIRSVLKDLGAIFQTTIDSEVILHLLTRSTAQEFEACLGHALNRVEGAYSLVVLHGDTLYAVRDPRGFRPLALGQLANGAWVVASESIAFDIMDAKMVRDIEPGETVRIRPGGEPESLSILEKKPHAQCIFELVYFSRPDTVIDGHGVHDVRERLGAQLWEEHPAEADVVIGVPDSSIVAALGYARAAGIPFETGLIRNHYIGRTFIEPHQEIRDLRARLKYNPVRSAIEGKRVVIVDDSIVRGTTCKRIVRMIRDCGAREIHFRISSPPWRNPCYYGIDTPKEEQLLAARHSIQEIGKIIGCDTIGFLSGEGLAKAIGRRDGWCMACFTGDYPTEKPRELSKESLEDSTRTTSGGSQ